jgi:glucokinase
MSYYIAIDISGTQLRAACYSTESKNPIHLNRTTTRAGENTQMESLVDLIDSVWPEDSQVDSIGAAVAGSIDPFDGVILESADIPEWSGLPLRKHLEEHFNIPVFIGNDANLAALAEWRFGAGKGHHHLIYLAVSTGIGGGVIMDDQLLLGKRGLAGELGHVTVLMDGPVCSCGQRGHLEAVASGTAIARWVQHQLTIGVVSSLLTDPPVSAKKVARAAQRGDALAIAALERAGSFIGQSLADYLHIFNPSIAIIGGGVSLSGRLLLEPISNSLKEHILSPHYLENFVLTRAVLGDEAGLIGALTLAQSSAAAHPLEISHNPAAD